MNGSFVEATKTRLRLDYVVLSYSFSQYSLVSMIIVFFVEIIFFFLHHVAYILRVHDSREGQGEMLKKIPNDELSMMW